MVEVDCLHLFIIINIVDMSIYVKLVLVVGMTIQMSDCKEVDIAIG